MNSKSKSPRKKLNLTPVYLEVAKLLLYKNPEQISFSLISKKTKVPRTTLYYYFNSDINSLITESIRFTMKEFMQIWSITSDKSAMSEHSWQQIQRQKFQKAITSIESSPYLLHLYFRYCGHPSFVGDEIREIEKLYLQNSEKEWNHFHAKKLNFRLQHLLAQVKVGILWGLTGEINNWKNQEEELAEICTKLFSFFEDLS